jgi:hypothetical protein
LTRLIAGSSCPTSVACSTICRCSSHVIDAALFIFFFTAWLPWHLFHLVCPFVVTWSHHVFWINSFIPSIIWIVLAVIFNKVFRTVIDAGMIILTPEWSLGKSLGFRFIGVFIMYVFLKYYDCVQRVWWQTLFPYLYASSLLFTFLFPVFAVHVLYLSIPAVISNHIRELRFGIFGTSRLVKAWYKNLRPYHRSDSMQL